MNEKHASPQLSVASQQCDSCYIFFFNKHDVNYSFFSIMVKSCARNNYLFLMLHRTMPFRFVIYHAEAKQLPVV